MEGKIGGTVRQIEAGDELSGSIINPHPLLFNILKTHTHTYRTELQLPAILPGERSKREAAIKILLMLKASAASQRF